MNRRDNPPQRQRLPRRTISFAALTVLGGLAILPSVIGCESQQEPTARNVTVITVWAHHGRAAEYEAMQRIVANFNAAHADQQLKIEIDFFPDRQYPDKVSIAAFSNALPDVVDIDGPYVGPWAAEGILIPLDDHLSADLRADLLPSLIEQGTFHDQLYALGAFDSALVVYYNRDIIAAADLNPPEHVADAWTWDQFVAALEQVKPHATVPLSLHMDDQSDEWFTYAFSPLIWSNGGQLIDTKKHRSVGVLNSAKNVAAIRNWQHLFEKGLAEARTTNPDPFSIGLAAFDWTGHWMLPTFEQADNLRFGVMPLPRMGDEFVAPSGSWCWGISRDCQHPEKAWQVIKWFLDPERGIKPVVEANGAVPGRKSAFELFPAYDQMPRRLFRAQLLEAARARPRTPVYLTLTSEFARALRDIATSSDVAGRLTQAAETVQRKLDRQK